MSFKDKSWCSAICDTTWCNLNFTAKQAKLAEEWWEGDGPAPVAFYTHHVGCSEYRPPVGSAGAKALDSIPRHDMVQSEVFDKTDPKIGGAEKTGNGA